MFAQLLKVNQNKVIILKYMNTQVKNPNPLTEEYYPINLNRTTRRDTSGRHG